MKYYLLTLVVLLAGIVENNAQMIGGQIFLQGIFSEVGISSCGVYGAVNPPATYNGNVAGALGFVADQEMDGWNISTLPGQPTRCGDYFYPGSPYEAWGIEINGVVYGNYNSFSTCDGFVPAPGGNIPGAVSSYSATSGTHNGQWEGDIIDGATNTNLHICQYTIVPDSELFFSTTITLTNNGSSPLNNVYYLRHLDPDNDEANSGNFNTNNTVVNNPVGLATLALCSATGQDYGCYLGMLSTGYPNSRAFIGGSVGSFPTLISDTWNSLSGYNTLVGSNNAGADDCMGITNFWPSIAPGASVTFRFYYVLDPNAINNAINSVHDIEVFVNGVSVTIHGGAGSGVGSCAATQTTDTLSLRALYCAGDSTLIDINSTVPYHWTWPSTPDLTLLDANGDSALYIPPLTSDSVVFTTTGSYGVGVDTSFVVLLITLVKVPPPVANLVVNNPYCMGDTINLDASGSTVLSAITSFMYDLDNNGVYEVNSPNPIYNASSNFASAGNYPISLITKVGAGCADTVSGMVQLYNLPALNLSVTSPTICLNDDGAFQALAFVFNAAGQSSTITNYAWDFDNNGTADTNGVALTNLTHHFNGVGTYPVVVMVSTSAGCERQDTINITLVDAPQGNIVAPTVCGNQAANFSFNSTGSPVASYIWDFGDLAVTTDVSTSATPSYLYPGQGTYNVTLIGSTANGCLDTMYANINVSPIPTGSISNIAVCQGYDETFHFVQTSTDTIVSYNWNLGNGTPSSSNLASPTSNFIFGGPLNISVIVTNQYGCSDTIVQPFIVQPNPIADFGIYPICISRFTFDPLVLPNDSSVTLDWNLGDGTILTGQDTSSFNHIYNQTGDLMATLFVVDQYGCKDSITKPVHVDDSLLVVMPNVLVQSSTIGNDKLDMDEKYPGFNLCVDYTYTVFDRWGVKVFQIHNDPNNPDLSCASCFKGRASNGALLTPGVYFYVMEGNFHIIKSGSITIFE